MFQLWREFRDYRIARSSVRLAVSVSEEQDNAALAALVKMPGYHLLKAAMMGSALNAIAKEGAKSISAPGLALGVGIIAQCEMAANEIMNEEAKKKANQDVLDKSA